MDLATRLRDTFNKVVRATSIPEDEVAAFEDAWSEMLTLLDEVEAKLPHHTGSDIVILPALGQYTHKEDGGEYLHLGPAHLHLGPNTWDDTYVAYFDTSNGRLCVRRADSFDARMKPLVGGHDE
jgi:hypothetical protein